MKNTFCKVAILGAAASVLSMPVSASPTFHVFEANVNLGMSVTATVVPFNSPPAPPVSGTFGFGQIVLATDLAGGTVGNPTLIDAWCIDFFHDIQVGGGPTYLYDVEPFASTQISNGDPSAVPPIFLTNSQLNEIAGLIAEGNSLLAGPSPTPLESLGTQLAIWQVEYAGAFSFTTGDGATDLLLTAEIAALIAGASGFPADGDALVSLSNAQGLATSDGGFITGHIPTVPEPASLAVLGVGLLGLRLIRRKRV